MRNKKNYPSIIIRYSTYLELYSPDQTALKEQSDERLHCLLIVFVRRFLIKVDMIKELVEVSKYLRVMQ